MEVNDVFPNGLSVDGALDLLRPLAVYVVGMAIYAVFIFKFYRFVASRDMFELDFSKYETSRFKFVRTLLHFVFYVLRYLILFPFFAFFWFAVLTIILAFLSSAEKREIADVLLVALATVGTIRIASYYNEDLSRDLAKILPFAVLGIFLIDASFFDISESLEILRQVDDHRETILYYLIALVALEFALRLAMTAITIFCAVRDRIRSGPMPPEDYEASPPAEEEPVAEEHAAQDYTQEEEPPRSDEASWSEAPEDASGEEAPRDEA